MTGFSLGTVWEETLSFLRRESALLIPVALAIYGPAQVMLDMGMTAGLSMREAARPEIPAQAWLVLPGALFLLLGNLAVTLIVLVPGISVGESLSLGLRRVPAALGAMLLLFTVACAAMLAVVVVGTVVAMAVGAGAQQPAAGLLVLVMIPVGLLWIRLLLLPTVVAREPLGPVDAIRRAWALGRGHLPRLVGIWLILLFLSILVAMLETFVVGSVVELLKRMFGDAELPALLQTLADAALEALLSMGLAVYLALVYRRLAEG